jgi:hypothetical protein
LSFVLYCLVLSFVLPFVLSFVSSCLFTRTNRLVFCLVFCHVFCLVLFIHAHKSSRLLSRLLSRLVYSRAQIASYQCASQPGLVGKNKKSKLTACRMYSITARFNGVAVRTFRKFHYSNTLDFDFPWTRVVLHPTAHSVKTFGKSNLRGQDSVLARRILKRSPHIEWTEIWSLLFLGK